MTKMALKKLTSLLLIIAMMEQDIQQNRKEHIIAIDISIQNKLA